MVINWLRMVINNHDGYWQISGCTGPFSINQGLFPTNSTTPDRIVPSKLSGCDYFWGQMSGNSVFGQSLVWICSHDVFGSPLLVLTRCEWVKAWFSLIWLCRIEWCHPNCRFVFIFGVKWVGIRFSSNGWYEFVAMMFLEALCLRWPVVNESRLDSH